jgi:hypothetical protein
LLAHSRWFSPGTLASSTTKTGRHDIAEILLKVALNTKNQKSNPCKTDVGFVFTPICFMGGGSYFYLLLYLFTNIGVQHDACVAKQYTTGATSEA